ncbi:DUF2690 domain-containing protein [Streptomyces polyrhachis]|uniref:DUF2690 domain-containing protein n=1 Tax=Streptomyces polyrhachis TaxID=1282885 RepID=A0ABW2GDC7_9ACTN
MPRWKELPEELDPQIREFAEQLRRVVDRSRLGVVAVADRTGYSRSSWERYLGGRLLPPQGAIEALAEVTGAEPGHLLTMWELAERAWSRSEARHDPTLEAIRIARAREALAEAESGPVREERTRRLPRLGRARPPRDAGPERPPRVPPPSDAPPLTSGAPVRVEGARSRNEPGDGPRDAVPGEADLLAPFGPRDAEPQDAAPRDAAAQDVPAQGVPAKDVPAKDAPPDRSASEEPEEEAQVPAAGEPLGRSATERSAPPWRTKAPAAEAAEARTPEHVEPKEPRPTPATATAATSATASAAPPPAETAAPAPPPPAPPQPAPPQPTPRPSRLRRTAGFVAVLLVVLGLGAGIVFGAGLLDGTDEPEARRTPSASPSPGVTLPEGIACQGEGCQGRDPETSGCGGENAATTSEAYVAGAYLELRFSTLCQAAWARVTDAPKGAVLTAGGKAGDEDRAARIEIDASGEGYTTMLPTTDPAVLRACVEPTPGKKTCARAVE